MASPLMESKGWAPSIPSVNIDKLNTNLKDLMIRAKGGIKNNDIIKEAHMAFYLGIMNEEEKKYESALKFYKKYFLSTKLLQDIYGTELALNRIAVLFSNIFDFEQSIYYNEKHKEITTHNLNGFVAYYNCGICYRVLENFEKSIENFQTALKMSEEENDLESYTLCLAQLAICFIFIGRGDNKCSIIENRKSSESPTKCIECNDFYCLDKKEQKCYDNDFLENTDKIFYIACIKTNEEGTACEECLDGYELNNDGYCVDISRCEEKDENNNCIKCFYYVW